MAEQETQTVTVTAISPVFMIRADGADTSVPAERTLVYLSTSNEWFMPNYTVNNRVQAQDRSPQQPVVTGFI